MRQRIKGFTTLELVTVMIVLSIISVFTMMLLPSQATFSLSSLTEQLRRDIRYTQMLAMSLSADYTITLTTSSYSISPTPPEGAVSQTMPSDVTLTAGSVTFTSTGAPTTGPTNLSITAGSTTNTLTVLAETGFVNG